MPHYVAERLPAADASYLLFESPNAHMHLSWVWIFDGGGITTADGGIDIAAIRRHVAARLYRLPRFRQRLVWTPFERHPVWVDDENFKLHYHVQHAALPDPGDDARLRITTAAIVSQPLDRSKPLWELWVVEGLRKGRFAIVSKTHHCMVDGVSTVDLMTGLLDPQPMAQPEEPADWIPRPAPSRTVLLRDALVERAGLAVRMARKARTLLRRPREWQQLVHAGSEAFATAWARPPETPFNRPVGPHRLVSWVRVPIDGLAEVAQSLAATGQDVALTAVAGAVTRLLARARVRPPIDAIRVVVPVHRRAASDPSVVGNRTDVSVIPLPINERDPRRRLRTIARATAAAQRETVGLHNMELPLGLAELGGRLTLGWGVAARRRLYACNLVVTDIPGPREPVYLLGARLAEAYPLVPLLDDQGLGFGCATYDGACHIGITADWEIVPDLSAVAVDVAAGVEELRRLGRRSRRTRRSPRLA